MRHFALAFAFVFLSAVATAQTTVTLSSTINLGAVAGAAKYQVQMQTDIGNQLAVSDPATNDPDGDKIVDVTPAANGTGAVGIAVWLAGKGAGNYLIFARSVDANGIAGPWSAAVAVTYGGPPAPPVTISALLNLLENSYALLPAREDHARFFRVLRDFLPSSRRRAGFV